MPASTCLRPRCRRPSVQKMTERYERGWSSRDSWHDVTMTTDTTTMLWRGAVRTTITRSLARTNYKRGEPTIRGTIRRMKSRRSVKDFSTIEETQEFPQCKSPPTRHTELALPIIPHCPAAIYRPTFLQFVQLEVR